MWCLPAAKASRTPTKQELHYFELSQSMRSSRGRVQIQDVATPAASRLGQSVGHGQRFASICAAMSASWLSALALSLLLGHAAAGESTQVQCLHACTGSTFLLTSHNQGHLQVTFGSLIKLVHEGSKAKLHSHEIAYGSGSGQQSVTGMRLQELPCIFLSTHCTHLWLPGYTEDNDANDYWAIKAPQVPACIDLAAAAAPLSLMVPVLTQLLDPAGPACVAGHPHQIWLSAAVAAHGNQQMVALPRLPLASHKQA